MLVYFACVVVWLGHVRLGLLGKHCYYYIAALAAPCALAMSQTKVSCDAAVRIAFVDISVRFYFLLAWLCGCTMCI